MNGTERLATARLRSRRVLVCAPVGRSHQLTCDVLQANGHPCQALPDLAATVEAASEGAGAIVLLEEALRPASAVAGLFELLKGQPAWSDLPVLILHSHAHHLPPHLAQLQRPVESRNLVLLQRPIAKADLLAMVTMALENRVRQYELRDALAALERSNEVLESFAYTVAHELRSPLSAFGMYVEILARSDGLPPEDRARVAEMARRSVQGMDATIAGLLAYGRLNGGEISLQPVDLDVVLEIALTSLDALLKSADARVAYASLPTVVGDSQLLVQLLQNLIKNAVVHNDGEQTTIEVRADRAGDRWRLQVIDDGPGIPEGVRERIFEMFVRGRGSQGSGIGLALCHQIAATHGSRLEVEAVNGGGTRFSIELEAPWGAGRSA